MTALIKESEQNLLGLDFSINKIQQLQVATRSVCANTANEATSEIEDDFLKFRSPGFTSVTPENILSAYISPTTI